MIDYQWADSVNGPWTRPPTGQTYVQPNGSILTLATNPQKYFRLTIGEIDFEDIQTPVVQVAHLRDETITIAEHHLQWLAMNFLGGSNGSSVEHAWANARLAPIALKVFDPAYRNGTGPAYTEFKIVSDFQPAEKPAEFLVGNEATRSGIPGGQTHQTSFRDLLRHSRRTRRAQSPCRQRRFQTQTPERPNRPRLVGKSLREGNRGGPDLRAYAGFKWEFDAPWK
jgi:hypothetical protein